MLIMPFEQKLHLNRTIAVLSQTCNTFFAKSLVKLSSYKGGGSHFHSLFNLISALWGTAQFHFRLYSFSFSDPADPYLFWELHLSYTKRTLKRIFNSASCPAMGRGKETKNIGNLVNLCISNFPFYLLHISIYSF
jgi:hypothetical protein